MLAKLELFLYWTSALIIVAITAFVCLDVALAQFRLPTYLSSEIGPFLMAALVFFALPVVTCDETHIRADFFDSFFSDRVRAAIRVFLIDLLFVVYVGILLFIASQTVWNGFQSGERTQNLLRTPIWIPQLAMILGLLALLLRTVVILINDARTFFNGSSSGQPRRQQ